MIQVSWFINFQVQHKKERHKHQKVCTVLLLSNIAVYLAIPLSHVVSEMISICETNVNYQHP